MPLTESGRAYGVMPLRLERGMRLAPWQTELMESVGHHIGAALATAARTQEQHRLALFEERSVLARELHDSLAQALAYLKIQVVRLQKNLEHGGDPKLTEAILSELREGLNSAYRQLRELLTTFRLRIDGRGFATALRETIDEFARRTEVAVEFDNRISELELSANEQIHLLQVVREALSNIEHHARAAHATVVLTRGADGAIEVTIDDDGVGINTAQAPVHHFGLAIMRDRAASLNGACTIARPRCRRHARAPVLHACIDFTLRPDHRGNRMTDSTPAHADAESVVIIDDHPLFRRGVAQLIEMESALALVGEASSGEEGLVLVRAKEPDLVLLDLNMKGMDGIATLKAIKDEMPEVRVILLTVSDAPDDLIAAIRAGADGYLLKDMDPEDLMARLREALTGRMVISDALSGRLAQALRDEAQVERRSTAGLTDRERTILRCLAEGKSNKLIARELDITEGTVKVHVKHLLRKLNFRSRVEAAVWAVAQSS